MADFRDNLGAEGASTSGAGPRTDSRSESADTSTAQQSHLISPPAISLPKGGGAIRGIGEKFAANPVTGTGSMTVPIATSPGRSGFGPQLSLSYDSGSGNGPFGFGWNLSLPSITRKTDKGLPRYRDAEESDEFILSGAEDLVPVLNLDGSRFEDTTTVAGYRIHRYRPRIEGLFARIERWTNTTDSADVHWRSISKDNVLTIYGKDAKSRICDPTDPGRIFSWLICETRDDKGNAIVYDYKSEDGTGVDLTKIHERNRGERDDPRRQVNRYIDSIRYGNRRPLLDDEGHRPRFLQPDELDGAGWMFEVVFDYHEPQAGEPELEPDQVGEWTFREDPFSSYRAGFEVRTTRLCQRVLMFHHIPDVPVGEPDSGEVLKGYDGLVRSTDFTYSHEQDPNNARNPVYTFLCEVTQTGYKLRDNGYVSRSLPPLEFEYTKPVVQDRVREVDPASLENLPLGLDGASYQWTDLHGEGIPGILTEQAGAWFYKRNLSPLRGNQVELAPLERVALKPNLALAGGAVQFMDLAGDGQPDLAVLDGPMPGLYEHDGEECWQPFRPFTARLNRDLRDPNLKLVDLTGDGHADVMISEDEAFVWHASLAEQGFGPARRAQQALNEEKGPRLVFADGTQAIYLADLSGDGLTDLARIRNGEVCYWPNLGYGRFGAKVSMDNAPLFDHPDQFDQKRIRLADIDGTGTTDIIYLHRDGVRIYFNQSGNGWSAQQVLQVFPRVDELATITPADLLGNGTACLVWSSPLPGDARRQMRYVDLMGGQKPHLLVKTENNLGAETRVAYAPSTKFYLRDKADGKPWITRLPFPVHVVERVETHDRISRNRFVTRYAYHHGYFDGEEREFRGFGMVEQWDTEELGVLKSPETAEDATAGAPQSHEPRYEIGDVATCSIRGACQFTFRLIIAIKPSIYPDGGWFYFFEGVSGGIHEDDVLLLDEAGSHAQGNVLVGTPQEEITPACATNIDESSYVPPVHTKTWFHTGLYVGRNHVSDFFAGLLDANDIGEYYREPGRAAEEETSIPNAHELVRELLLEDTVLPDDLTFEEEREACRALKGSMLRQEVYALDGTEKAKHPYTVTEQNFDIRPVQPRGDNRHAVFFTHPREAINYHYERNPADPRISHALTLEVDDFGNVLKEAAIGYGRREMIRRVNENGVTEEIPNPGLDALDELDPSFPEKQVYRDEQTRILMTYTENQVTNAIDASSEGLNGPDSYRTPLPADTRTYELRKPQQETTSPGQTALFRFKQVESYVAQAGDGDHDIEYEDWFFEKAILAAANDAGEAEKYFRRLIEHVRTRYRRDDLNGLLTLGELQPLALPGESYKLAFTSELLAQVFQRPLDAARPQGAPPPENLLTDSATILPIDRVTGEVADRGGYVDLDSDGRWWIPSGRIFFSPTLGDAPEQERDHARDHFFLLHRYLDPFDQTTTVFFDDHKLLTRETRDPLDNRVTVGERQANSTFDPATPTNIDAERPSNDYRVLQPELVMGPNRNRTQVAFDALGMVVGTAVMGKPEESLGDLIDEGFDTDLKKPVIREHLDEPLTDPHTVLGSATTRLVYDLSAYVDSKDKADPKPAVVYTLARETHVSDVESGERTKIQHSFSYSDGFGREIQKKIQAESERTTGEAGDPRWVGSGWTVFNNKGKPVRQYEPFFSELSPTDRHKFEFDARVGVSPTLFYDPLGRVVATLHPNHTWEKVVFDPWRQEVWDVNDTSLANPSTDLDLGDYFGRLADADYLPTWYALRTDAAHAEAFAAQYPDAANRSNETQAAEKTTVHAETPAISHFDALGRTFLTLAHNRYERRRPDGTSEIVEDPPYRTRIVFDIEGNQREVIDAKDRVVMRYHYDMLGHRIHQASVEAGERWMLNDVSGNPVRAWDSRGHGFRNLYGPLRRPLEARVRGADPEDPAREILYQRTLYGEGQDDDVLLNLRTRIYRIYDGAGVVTNRAVNPTAGREEAYDFKGNLLRSIRQLAPDYRSVPDWSSIPAPDTEPFVTSTTYDALNRPATLTTPDNSVVRPSYNAANLLEAIEANLQGSATATRFVDNIDYNAKGQRERIDYGNGARSEYSYDHETFRLIHLFTSRGGAFPEDCPERPPRDWPGCAIQNLRYTYDPAGNITHIRDRAQQTIFFRNQRVEPSNAYTYDAIYRLIQAEGREHIGQASRPWTTWNDAGRVGLEHPHNGEAMRRYTERYEYDDVGNFSRLSHDADLGTWRREYECQEPSLIEVGRYSNRLSRTNVDGVTELYTHDSHGNMTSMPHLQQMDWDFKDQLQRVDLEGGGTAYYLYDAAGQRVRKVIERLNTGVQEERIYLGGFEVYRQYSGAEYEPTLERQTLHVMYDTQRIAIVENRTAGHDEAPRQLVRYQLGNHLGSASLELDALGLLISYEEYHPYGTSSYQAVRRQTETPKRYRYTGMERDEETGLNYHSARYYALWLGRWTICDPRGIAEGLNLYKYVDNNPVVLLDSSGLDNEITVHHRTTARNAESLTSQGFNANINRSRSFLPGNWFLNNPNIPNNAAASGETIVSQRISTQNVADISGHSVVDQLRALGSGNRDLSRSVRLAAESATRGWVLNPGETRLQAYIRSQLPAEAREAPVIRFRNPDGTFTYIVRNNSAYLGRPTITGTVRGGRFRPSARSGSGGQPPPEGASQQETSQSGGTANASQLVSVQNLPPHETPQQSRGTANASLGATRGNAAVVALPPRRPLVPAPRPPLPPNVVELDPRPSGAANLLLAAQVGHDLAEVTGVADQTLEEVVTTNPGPYAAGATILYILYGAVEGTRITGDFILDAIVSAFREHGEWMASDEYYPTDFGGP